LLADRQLALSDLLQKNGIKQNIKAYEKTIEIKAEHLSRARQMATTKLPGLPNHFFSNFKRFQSCLTISFLTKPQVSIHSFLSKKKHGII
jgi:septation ring formation regulator EzrA